MEIVVHWPEGEGERRELARRAALVHAQTIAEKLAALPCPVEQKAALYKEIEERYQARSGGPPGGGAP